MKKDVYRCWNDNTPRLPGIYHCLCLDGQDATESGRHIKTCAIGVESQNVITGTQDDRLYTLDGNRVGLSLRFKIHSIFSVNDASSYSCTPLVQILIDEFVRTRNGRLAFANLVCAADVWKSGLCSKFATSV